MTEDAAIVRACAKVNLLLRVGPRREDGYHELRTLFQTVDLADDLALERRPAGVTLASIMSVAPPNVLSKPFEVQLSDCVSPTDQAFPTLSRATSQALSSLEPPM